MFGSEDRVIIRDVPSLDKVRAVCNKVVVRIDHEVAKSNTEAGLIMCADTDWDETGNCNVHGTVVKVPEKLFRREKPKNEFGMEHGTIVEVEKGDEVWFMRSESFNCPAFIIDEKLYYLIDYAELILAVRDDKKILLNGNILMRRVFDGVEERGLFTGISEKEDKCKGVVEKVGRPNDWYLTKGVVEPNDIEEGDKVISKLPMINLENSLYSVLDDCVYMQRRWLVAVM